MPTYTVFNASNVAVLNTPRWGHAVRRLQYLQRHCPPGASLEVDGKPTPGLFEVLAWTVTQGRGGRDAYRDPTPEELLHLTGERRLTRYPEDLPGENYWNVAALSQA